MNGSFGKRLADTLFDSIRAYQLGPVAGVRAREIIYGVTDKGTFVGGMTVDGFFSRAGNVLLDSGRLYRFGNSVCIETKAAVNQELTMLTAGNRADPGAPSVLTNLFGIGVKSGDSVKQSLVPARLIGGLLADESLWERLPELRYYARRPTFDEDFQLCRPGWNAGSGILVHGPTIEPVLSPPAYGPNARAIERLPRHLGSLLREFHWRSDADLTNAVAMLLTGLLINHFIDDPHPAGIVDANQSQVGKTLLIQSIGRVLDGIEPTRIALVRDEDLEKKLCAQLRSGKSSLFFLDNVRVRIESMVLEQNILSPLLSFRILGQSATVERPNTYLWMFSSNMTTGTPDYINRGVPIQLNFDGNPRTRKFKGKPLKYAKDHRLEILGELAGMVIRWVEQGRPPSHHEHRCDRWAATLGGILEVNGLGAFFLANVEEAEKEMDQSLIDLASLAEHVVARGPAWSSVPTGGKADDKGKPAKDWVPIFTEAQVILDKVADRSARSKETSVGSFLRGKIDRQVDIATADGPRTATLRARPGVSRHRNYYFEITPPTPTDRGDAPTPAETSPPASPGPDSADIGSTTTPAPPARASSAPVNGSTPPGGGAVAWL